MHLALLNLLLFFASFGIAGSFILPEKLYKWHYEHHYVIK